MVKILSLSTYHKYYLLSINSLSDKAVERPSTGKIGIPECTNLNHNRGVASTYIYTYSATNSATNREVAT